MEQFQQGQNQQTQPPMQPAMQNVVHVHTVEKKSNGIGVAGFVLALLGLIFTWVPILCWFLWFLGLLFSFIGVFKKPRGLSIAGLVISIINFILLVMALGVFAAAVAA